MAPGRQRQPGQTAERHLPGAGTGKGLVGDTSDLVSGGAGLLGLDPACPHPHPRPLTLALSLALAIWRRGQTTCADLHRRGGILTPAALGDRGPFARRGSRASVGRDRDVLDRRRGISPPAVVVALPAPVVVVLSPAVVVALPAPVVVVLSPASVVVTPPPSVSVVSLFDGGRGPAGLGARGNTGLGRSRLCFGGGCGRSDDFATDQ